ncbi:hypothetical protein [Weissella hellenica]|uniref:Uncharacterized protein n=1 Tax=Weissella hellenica TaxID=46256 RepID=A0A4Y4G164_WEIHE|nr:hypothetical protein [Weissella hellenica]NKY66566.1 hypothetical protein [Weissella hellenica]GED35256.1 hypothetical protein WHE01_01600 [Weissella hellenica]SCB82104.1 hypothetical protein GA0061075_10357 [Weissella hellenica]
MPMQRPIVFYENLMHTYDNQVAELLAAKTTYILLASDQDNEVQNLGVIDEALPTKPVITEVLQPKVKKEAPKQTTTKKTAKVNKTLTKAKAKPKSIKTGLGLSLDDILSEEDSVAARDHNQYFND